MTLSQSERELLERSVLQAIERHSGPELDAALEAFGWSDALATDPAGAVSVLFSMLGSGNATSSALDLVLAFGLGVEPQGKTIVLPPLGSWVAPGRIRGDKLSVQGLAKPALPEEATVALLAAIQDGADSPIMLEVDSSALDIRPTSGIDPAYGLIEVTGETSAFSRDIGVGGSWHEAVAMAQLALAYELVGCSTAMLELARTHALERIQFDRPIATFQAVRHRLAESLVAIEAAREVLDAAWHDTSHQLAPVAKAISGRSARAVGRHCQQVLAGIGFTAEHPFHRHLRRIMLLDQLFGASRSLIEEIGNNVVAHAHVPAMPAL